MNKWYLMYDGLVLGTFIKHANGVIMFEKKENVIKTWLPLFLELAPDGVDVSKGIVVWMKERVIPPNRIGIKRILKRLGMKKYDVMEMGAKFNYAIVTDAYWIATKEDDTYTKCSIRATFNMPYNSLDIKNEENFEWKI